MKWYWSNNRHLLLSDPRLLERDLLNLFKSPFVMTRLNCKPRKWIGDWNFYREFCHFRQSRRVQINPTHILVWLLVFHGGGYEVSDFRNTEEFCCDFQNFRRNTFSVPIPNFLVIFVIFARISIKTIFLFWIPKDWNKNFLFASQGENRRISDIETIFGFRKTKKNLGDFRDSEVKRSISGFQQYQNLVPSLK